MTDKVITLTLFQKIILAIFGSVEIGKIREEGWTDSLPLYAFNCDDHGLQTNYPSGNGKLHCKECIKKMYEENKK